MERQHLNQYRANPASMIPAVVTLVHYIQLTYEMELDIVRAKESDQDRVFDYLSQHFYPEEPLNEAVNAWSTITRDNCASLGVLKGGLSLIAVKKDDPNVICAVFINKEIIKDETSEEWPKLLARTHGTPYGKILKFLDDTGSMTNDLMEKIWDKYDTDRAMDIYMISVHKDNRRQKLAQRLMEISINLAREKKYRWITIGCTSTYSAKLALKIGFKLIFELPYNEYKDEQGEVVFRTSPAHDAFRLLIKELPA